MKANTHRVFCHAEFGKPSSQSKRFCGTTCTHQYSSLKKRIYSIYDGEELVFQFTRFEELGENYTFDEANKQLNLLYNLGKYKR